MACYLVRPINFTVISSQSAATNPADNLNNDYPNMVWRSTSTTSVLLEVRIEAGDEWDFVGLVGANLYGADSIRLAYSGSLSTVRNDPSYVRTMNVSGAVNSDTNLVFHAADAVRSGGYFRLEFTLSGNPNAFVQAQRLVIGKRVQADGIDVGSDFNFEDTSRVSEYRGIQIVDAFDAKQSWKFSISNVKTADYNVKWRAMLKAASGKPVLFIPDTENGGHNQESVFGRIQGQTNAGLSASDQYKINLYIREV